MSMEITWSINFCEKYEGTLYSRKDAHQQFAVGYVLVLPDVAEVLEDLLQVLALFICGCSKSLLVSSCISVEYQLR